MDTQDPHYGFEPDVSSFSGIGKIVAVFIAVALLLVGGLTTLFDDAVKHELQRPLSEMSAEMDRVRERTRALVETGVDPSTGERFLPIDDAIRTLVDDPALLRAQPVPSPVTP